MTKLSALDALMASNPVVTETVRIKRLGVDFEVKSLTGDDIQSLKAECTKMKRNGKKMEEYVDNDELSIAMIAKATINPDFSNADLMAKFGASTSIQCVNKALVAGEIFALADKITEISGLKDDDEIDDLKN